MEQVGSDREKQNTPIPQPSKSVSTTVLFAVIGFLVLIILVLVFFSVKNTHSLSQVTSTPSPAQIPVSNPVLITTALSMVYKPTVLVSAKVANGITSLLKPGDMVFAFSMRDRNGSPVSTSSQKFQMALHVLSLVQNTTIHKMIVLSTVDDLNAVKQSITADIDTVGYNTEGGITPQSEILNAQINVPQFASIVHSLGKKMMYAPSHDIFDMLQLRGDLGTILKSVDIVVYQGQNILPSEGQTQFVKNMQAKYQ